MRGYRALATLQEPARFGAWLLRIVGNLSLNYRRARKARSIYWSRSVPGRIGRTSSD